MKTNFPVASLGDYVRQVSQRNKDKSGTEVFSVTNSEGFTRSTDYFSKEVFSKDISNYKVVRKGQFAYNPSRINVGSIDYLRPAEKALVSPLYVVFETNTELSAEYLLRYMKSDWGNEQIRANTEGAVRDSLKYRGLESIKIPLPPLDDQKRIAHLLGKVEGLIARRKHHLQQLDDLLKSVFLEMFGDPVRNEKGWDNKPLALLGDLDRGVSKHRPRNAPELLNGKYPLIQTGDVSNAGTYIEAFTQTYSELGFAQSKLWPAGTLCITIAANIAQTGILTFDACFPDSVVGFTADEGEANALYILGIFWFFQRILEKNAPAAAQKNINLRILRELEVPAPPRNLQNQFAAIVEKVEGLKSRYQQSLTDLESLYGALSQKAFKGELDLSRVVLPAEGPEIAGEEKTDVEEIQAMEPLFELPAPEALAVWHTAEGRKSLLSEWLNGWLAHLGGEPFAAQAFMDAARQRLWALVEDEAPEWGVAEYDELKAWVFEALAQGRLIQGYDDANNRVQLKTAIK
jgi:type I restriction enzyme S subunit